MNKINVYYTKINYNFQKEKFDEYYNLLPNILKKKIDRLMRYQSKINSLIGIKLLETALSNFNYPKIILKEIKYFEDGKPYLPNAFCFNISHSHNIVMCACYKTAIGADIEKYKSRDISRLSTYFSKNEYELLLKSKEQNKLFAEIWTKKEAFSKAVSKGMNLPFANINIKKLTVLYKNKNWSLYPINIDKEYASHICIGDNGQNINIIPVNF